MIVKKHVVVIGSSLRRKYVFEILCAIALICNALVLIIQPNHISFVSMLLLLTNFLALSAPRMRRSGSGYYKAALLSFVYSLAYLLLVLYWYHAGVSECSEFFGSYRSCLGSAQQNFVEIVSLPLIILTSTRKLILRHR